MLWACPCGGPPVADRYLLLIDTHTQSTCHQRWLSTLFEPLIVPTRSITPDALGEAETKSRDPDTRERASHNLLGLSPSPPPPPRRGRAAVPVRDPPRVSSQLQDLERRVHALEAFLQRLGFGGS